MFYKKEYTGRTSSLLAKRCCSQLTFIALCLTVLLSSCKNIDVFEKSTPIPEYKWTGNFAAEGSFVVTDTTAPYNIYIVLRHTDAYNYNNIWLDAGLQPPGDSMQHRKLNISLGSDAQGWEGSGMNDIWEVRKLILRAPKMKKGIYRFRLSQIMRDEPLLHVMSAGLRLEKAR